MKDKFFIQQLAEHVPAIQGMVQGVTQTQASWKPSPKEWSILEVVNHLFDEEIEDFRAHLDAVLFHPEQEWISIDPQSWVIQRQYNLRDVNSSLANFLTARQDSLKWLRSLKNPNWDSSFPAPWGKLTAGDLLASWAAHDLLAMRQLVELHYTFNLHQAAPYKVQYAGGW